jgi:DNA-directed RNA polymerase specialized sigma24 family protein
VSASSCGDSQSGGPYAFRQYSNRQIAAMLAVSERTVRPDRSSRLVQQRR